MNHYLVITHRTAPSPELTESLARLREADRYSAFTLLVTATHHPLAEHDARIEAHARERGEEARRQLLEAGVYLTRMLVGAGSPSVAAKDELIARPDTYDAIILHTRPPGLRAVAGGDMRRRIEEDTGIPVFHAYRGSEEPWRLDRSQPRSRLGRLWQRTRFEEQVRPGELPGQAHAPSRREMLPVVAFMLLYLAGGLTLALTVNRGFYLNDVVALIIYTVVIGGLLFVMSREL